MLLLGSIDTITVYLRDRHTIMADPPSFTLIGDTIGGPPVTNIWTRDGDVISDGGPYSISVEVNEINTLDVESVREVLQESPYRSTLTVVGNIPGVYAYSVINRSMLSSRTANITILGIIIATL